MKHWAFDFNEMKDSARLGGSHAARRARTRIHERQRPRIFFAWTLGGFQAFGHSRKDTFVNLGHGDAEGAFPTVGTRNNNAMTLMSMTRFNLRLMTAESDRALQSPPLLCCLTLQCEMLRLSHGLHRTPVRLPLELADSTDALLQSFLRPGQCKRCKVAPCRHAPAKFSAAAAHPVQRVPILCLLGPLRSTCILSR